MEVTFNPMIPAEADFVRRMLTPGDVAARVEGILSALGPTHSATVDIVGELAHAEVTPKASEVVIHAYDNPEYGETILPTAGSTVMSAGGASAASAIPLPPAALSTAAADLFPTAPEVQTAGIPMPPGAALPPVPLVPAAPPAPPAPAPATSHVGAGELDKDGLPWNAEIHSGNKAKNADGRWRQRRNLDPAVLERVTAQLRALMAMPAPGAASATPAAPNATVPPAPVTVVPAGQGATAILIDPSVSPVSPVIPPAPAASVPLPPAVAPAPIAAPPVAPDTPAAPASFAVVLRFVTDSLATRKITEADVNQALADIGGVQIGQLAARPDLLAEFHRNILAKVSA